MASREVGKRTRKAAKGKVEETQPPEKMQTSQAEPRILNNVIHSDNLHIQLTAGQVIRIMDGAVTRPVNGDYVAVGVTYALKKAMGGEDPDAYVFTVKREDGGETQTVKEGRVKRLRPEVTRYLLFKTPSLNGPPIFFHCIYDGESCVFVSEDLRCIQINRHDLVAS